VYAARDARRTTGTRHLLEEIWMRPIRAFPVMLLVAALHASVARAQAPVASGAIEPPIANSPIANAPVADAPVANARSFRFLLSLGFDRGSERVAVVDMDDGSRQPLRAGEGFFFTAGGSFLRHDLGATSIDTAATVGVKGWNAGADNGSVDYLAFPLEVVERLSVRQVRLGLGVSYLMAPRIKSKGIFAGMYDEPMKNSLGMIARAEWIGRRAASGRGMFIGARVVVQKLEPKSGAPAWNANGVGVDTGFEF
jgi:hypothetical protein